MHDDDAHKHDDETLAPHPLVTMASCNVDQAKAMLIEARSQLVEAARGCEKNEHQAKGCRELLVQVGTAVGATNNAAKGMPDLVNRFGGPDPVAPTPAVEPPPPNPPTDAAGQAIPASEPKKATEDPGPTPGRPFTFEG